MHSIPNIKWSAFTKPSQDCVAYLYWLPEKTNDTRKQAKDRSESIIAKAKNLSVIFLCWFWGILFNQCLCVKMCVGKYAFLCSKFLDIKHNAIKILSQCMLISDGRSTNPGGLRQMSTSSSEELLQVGGCNSRIKLGAEVELSSSITCYSMGHVTSERQEILRKGILLVEK